MNVAVWHNNIIYIYICLSLIFKYKNALIYSILISPKDKLILTNNTISLECMTWTILHSLLLKDYQLFEQLENAQDYHWEPTAGNPCIIYKVYINRYTKPLYLNK